MKDRLKKFFSFANIIVIICVGMGIVITCSILYEYHRLDVVIPSEMLTGFWVFWGGELLILALRQVFGSDVVNGKGKNETEEGKI